MKLSRYRHGYFFLIFKVRSTYAVCLGDFATPVTIDSGAGINGLTATPEAASLLLLGTGLCSPAGWVRSRKWHKQ